MNSTPRAKSTSTREDRAAALLAAGAVTLNLDGTATVKGAGKAVYVITKEAGCPCPDRTRRNLPCKHEIACLALCKLARACREQAKETGRTRLPYLLGLALRGRATEAPAPAATCRTCGTGINGGVECLPCGNAALFGVAA